MQCNVVYFLETLFWARRVPVARRRRRRAFCSVRGSRLSRAPPRSIGTPEFTPSDGLITVTRRPRACVTACDILGSRTARRRDLDSLLRRDARRRRPARRKGAQLSSERTGRPNNAGARLERGRGGAWAGGRPVALACLLPASFSEQERSERKRAKVGGSERKRAEGSENERKGAKTSGRERTRAEGSEQQWLACCAPTFQQHIPTRLEGGGARSRPSPPGGRGNRVVRLVARGAYGATGRPEPPPRPSLSSPEKQQHPSSAPHTQTVTALRPCDSTQPSSRCVTQRSRHPRPLPARLPLAPPQCHTPPTDRRRGRPPALADAPPNHTTATPPRIPTFLPRPKKCHLPPPTGSTNCRSTGPRPPSPSRCGGAVAGAEMRAAATPTRRCACCIRR